MSHARSRGLPTVARLAFQRAKGNTVIIDQGQGLYSLLAHLDRALVMNGDRLADGDVVEFIGATGRATGPHLHWSVRLQGARVDPRSLVRRTRAT